MEKVFLPFECLECQRSFKNKAGLCSHLRAHQRERPSYSCSLCEKVCRTQAGLKKHTLGHQRNKLCCNYCIKTFASLKKYDEHMNVHNSIYPFVCQICGRFLDTETIFDRHCKSHRRTHVFFCALCFHGFSSKQSLSKHIARHPDPVPKHCSFCLRTFTTDRQKRMHEEIHKNELMAKGELQRMEMDEERKKKEVGRAEEKMLEECVSEEAMKADIIKIEIEQENKQEMDGRTENLTEQGCEMEDLIKKEPTEADHVLPPQSNGEVRSAKLSNTVQNMEQPSDNNLDDIKKEENDLPFFFM